jgi:D-alanine-D-alanine ligase
VSKQKPVVAIVFGGTSGEHSISCLSAAGVLNALSGQDYEVLAVGITKKGEWFIQPTDPSSLAEAKLPEVKADGIRVFLSTDRTIRGFVAVDGSPLPSNYQNVDVIFPVLHGPGGEDGTIQGAIELAGIACVGSGVFASAASMDKQHMKALFDVHGLPNSKSVTVNHFDWQQDKNKSVDAIAELGFPLFIKPARAGSSLGVAKVKSKSEISAAVEEAQKHDPKIIAEEAIGDMREIECGVLVVDGVAKTSVPAEIVVKGNHDFYDFDAKYLDDSADLIVPANLPDEIIKEVQAKAIQSFNALGCEGFARCDFFVKSSGEVLINEINTLPGFTAISMFPRMWQATGFTYPQIIEVLISDALRRGAGLR